MKILSCKVRKNCKTMKDQCWCCENYGLYQPKDCSILSPRQEENRIEKALQKKVKKQSSASKRGKSNRRNGRVAERELVKWLEKHGLEANLVPMSGALKSANIIKALANDEMVEKMRGDIKLTINGETYTVESKRNVNSDSWYKKAEKGVIQINTLAYLMREDLFMATVNGVDIPVSEVIEDKGFKKIHEYFEQDDSDIVVISRPYCHRLFFIKEKTYERIHRIKN
nr:MAG TPA: HJC-DNA COMPLEX, HYDROLASE DNA COMPLEX [Caudoviricetes sp.]